MAKRVLPIVGTDYEIHVEVSDDGVTIDVWDVSIGVDGEVIDTDYIKFGERSTEERLT